MIVVFDIGNVLVRWDPRYLYRKVFDDEARMERFLVDRARRWTLFHTPTSPQTSPPRSRRGPEAFPEFAKEIRMFHERWIETLGGPIEENVALLRR